MNTLLEAIKELNQLEINEWVKTTTKDTVLSHATRSMQDLANIFKTGLKKGRKGTVSFTNQFIENKDDIPGTIIRNSNKFSCAINLDFNLVEDYVKKVGNEIISINQFSKYLTGQEKGKGYTRIHRVGEGEDGNYYLQVYNWPGLFKISKELYTYLVEKMLEFDSFPILRQKFNLNKSSGWNEKYQDEIVNLKSYYFYQDNKGIISSPSLTVKKDDLNNYEEWKKHKDDPEYKVSDRFRLHIYLNPKFADELCNQFTADEGEYIVKNDIPDYIIKQALREIWLPEIIKIPSDIKFNNTNLSDKLITNKNLFNLKTYFDIIKTNNKVKIDFIKDAFNKNEISFDYINLITNLMELINKFNTKKVQLNFYSEEKILVAAY